MTTTSTVIRDMGSPQDHRSWSERTAELARRLAADEDATAQRWAVVAAYYSVMHSLQAIAADNGEQREIHAEVIEVPGDFDLPGHASLEARTRELYNFCNKARYLRGTNAPVEEWFMPYAQNASDFVANAIALMESVLADL